MNNNLILYSKFSSNCEKLLNIINNNSNIPELSKLKLISIDSKKMRYKIKENNINIVPTLLILSGKKLIKKIEGINVIVWIDNIIKNYQKINKKMYKEIETELNKEFTSKIDIERNKIEDSLKNQLSKVYEQKFNNHLQTNLSNKLNEQKIYYEEIIQKIKMQQENVLQEKLQEQEEKLQEYFNIEKQKLTEKIIKENYYKRLEKNPTNNNTRQININNLENRENGKKLNEKDRKSHELLEQAKQIQQERKI